MNLRKFKNKVLVGAGSTLAVFGLGTLSVFSPQISANGVNDYIFSKNYQKKTTVNNIQWWLNHRDDANMSYRYGKPEGVLVHETANSGDKWDCNAIWNEINYMLNHSDSAFVHSFVDSNQAIEIADSGYLSWGAGAMGNARFIQTEQVQVEGKDAFAEELFNLAVLQASYLKKYNLSPSLGGTVWSHSMVSHQLGGTNHSDPDGYWADMAARFFGTTYTMNDYEYLLEQIYNQANVKAKYKVGDKVQIASYATNEANGYDLRPRQNWVGTVKSVTANNQGNSHFEYYVEYGNADENNMHVLEQDLQAAPAEKYKQGDVVSIATGAISGTTGQSLTEYRGFTGTVKSVKIKNHASSHYQYALDVGGKTVSYIPEQDVVDAPARKYKAGDKVAISSAANVESNGHNLQPRRGYIGTVKSSAIMNKYSSHYEYYVDYGDGTGNGHVLEQDLITPPAAKYNVGDKVKILNSANVDSNGYNLQPRRGWIGTVKSIAIMNKYSSHYEYYIDYGDGTGNGHVLEQDLTSNINQPSFKAGDKVKILNSANVEANGHDLKPRRGWIGTIESSAIKNKYSSNYEYYVDYGDGTGNGHVLEQDLTGNINQPSYQAGDTVQILNSANVESNGYDLKPHRGWVGTIKSSAIKNKYSSNYEYYIDYGDGTANEHVLEQDLTKNVPTPKYKVGQTITIASDAINETNGHNLVPRRGWVGLVKSVVIKNHASSHYEYYIDYTDGTGNGHVSEQDISETFPAAKFKAGDKVKVSDVALSESNGSDLISQRNKAGVVRSMAIKNSASSHYEYWVDYADGTRSEHVLEQDLLFN